ncbi:hypothetical protein K438DRAFT_1965960 [Mycena galopus ATCC 62051]|nr:hypothetical protein K438DRAFT_1965960 [Mycena galopus ATCC 62051]
MPPSAPKAQSPNAIGLGGASGSGVFAPRFNGMSPQTVPSNVLRLGQAGGAAGSRINMLAPDSPIIPNCVILDGLIQEPGAMFSD